jgi:plasmid stability protein
MSKMIQVRNVPDALHEELMRRARARGQTLTDFIQEILEREVARPQPEEVFQRIRRRAPVDLPRPAATLIRQEREKKERR